MSLFGSLFTGVSGLAAQSQSMAMISNNIANVNTTGFKRSEASFFSLVTTEGRSSRYSPGTVSVNRVQRVDQQGPIQQTASATDVAVSGNGFFVVKQDTNNPDVEFHYTRSGSFSEDAQGYLKNTAGFFLYGWPLDSQGNLPAGQGDLSSLVPVDVAFLGGLTRPTTNAELSINLNASEDDYVNVSNIGGAQVGSVSLPVQDSLAPNFTRGLRVFDSLGSAQDLSIEYRKITGPMAQAVSGAGIVMDRNTSLTTLAGVTAGDTFTIDVGVYGVQEYIIGAAAGAGQVRIDTLGDLQDELNDNYGSGNAVDATITSTGQLLIQARNIADSITLDETNGTPLWGVDSLLFPGSDPTTYDPFTLDPTLPASATNPYGTGQGDFPDFANNITPNTQGWWELKVKYPDGSLVTSGLLNFNTDGSINAAPDSSNEIDIELNNLDWNNGSSLQDINIDISRFSQFSGEFDVIYSDQNGAELGLRTGVEIDRDGYVIARFSNGASTKLYKLPIATFSNVNGLAETSGTAYTETELSGQENLREAGRGGSGFLESSTIEGSNVDIADEFAKMIVTQRAFSANTRVINTADQMTEDLIRLR